LLNTLCKQKRLRATRCTGTGERSLSVRTSRP
jgi:hypothetical protein